MDSNTTKLQEINIKASVKGLKLDADKTKIEEKDMSVYTEDVIDITKFNNTEIEEDQDTRFEDFEKWLIDHGAEFPDLYLKKYTENIRGVHAKRDIEPYQTVVSIPLKLLITDEMGRTQTKIGREVFSQRNNLSTPNLIAVVIYMLETREDPNHFFQPYYKVLPADYSNFPIFWDETKLSWLTGSPLLEDIEDRKHNMQSDYKELCAICPEFKRFSFEEFLEIRTAVGSRNFGIVIQGSKLTSMIAMADLLNHLRPRQTSWTYDNSRGAFTITSLTNLISGSQIFDSYGKKCNSKFLLHYGFAVERNREENGQCQNEILIQLSLAPATEDVLFSSRVSFLGASRISRCFRLSMNIEDKATSDALSYLRVAVANEQELAIILSRSSRQQLSSSNIRFVSPRNEAAALQRLAEACKEQLAGYPEDYEANKALLSSGTVAPFSDRRTALVVVLGEQEICHFWVNTSIVLGEILLSGSSIDIQDSLKNLPRETDESRDRYRYAMYVLSAFRQSLNNNALN